MDVSHSNGVAMPTSATIGGLGSMEQIETMCKQLYESTDPAARQEAESTLLKLASSSQYIPECMWILDNGKVRG